MTHTVKGFGIVNKAEVDVFLELSCFFNDPTDVGNLISGSSAFSKSSLNIWKFSVHILLKPHLENFEHYFANVLVECNCAVVWAFFCIAFLWDWNETDLFQSCGHCWVFQICWPIEYSTFTASSFRILNSPTGIPSPPLALCLQELPKVNSNVTFTHGNFVSPIQHGIGITAYNLMNCGLCNFNPLFCVLFDPRFSISKYTAFFEKSTKKHIFGVVFFFFSSDYSSHRGFF